MSFRRAWVGVLAAGLLAAAALSACSSDDEPQPQAAQLEPQPTQQAQPSQQAQATAAQTSDESDDGAASASAQTAEPQQQQQQQADEPQPTAPAEDEQPVPQQDDEDESSVIATNNQEVEIVMEAAYDELSPRLQLLRDSGYPVYLSQDYIIALGTPDLAPGTHRISIVIEGPVGLIEFPAIMVAALPLVETNNVSSAAARFARFPDGVRGFHVATLEFDGPGLWYLVLNIPAEEGFDIISLVLDIPEDTLAPSVGDAAPASASRTLLDVPNIADLSTGETPDPGLYLVSLAEAVEADKPFVVVFASPGFCTNAFCGPQAEVLSQVRERFGDAANYIHIDLYENPEQVRLGEEPIETPILEEWGLHTDEWTFVVNADGVVTARFEAFAPYAEVEAALSALLEG